MPNKKKWKKFICWFFGHDPQIAMATYEGKKYIVTYVCDCGKRVKIDETVVKFPYLMIRKMFREAKEKL